MSSRWSAVSEYAPAVGAVLLGVVVVAYVFVPSVVRGLVSVFSNSVLEVLTGVYAFLTLLLVVETRRSRTAETERWREERTEERERREREERRRRNNLRRALVAELDEMLETVHASEYTNTTFGVDNIQRTVYEANSDELGALTEEECAAVVDCYTSATVLSRMVSNGLERDTPSSPAGSAEVASSVVEEFREKARTAKRTLSRNLE